MLVSELKEKLNLTEVTSGTTDREISGCYIGDMLSVVMSKANEGEIWLTVQTNVNIDAVAVLANVACIIIVEGLSPDSDTISKANMQDVIILKSPDTAFDIACRIKELL